MVVDSASADKSYFAALKPYDVLIEDVGNKHWLVGAYWHGYRKYPEEDFYYFLHDSMRVKANLDSLKQNDLTLLATFSREASPTFNAWNDRIRKATQVSPVKTSGRGCYGIIFFCKNKVITSLYNKGAHKLLPTNKAETGYMEGAFGLFLEGEGYDLDRCSLLGDILALEAPGGRSGPAPHNTAWQHPIEKFYAAPTDQQRN
jgi:hypothetical protein